METLDPGVLPVPNIDPDDVSHISIEMCDQWLGRHLSMMINGKDPEVVDKPWRMRRIHRWTFYRETIVAHGEPQTLAYMDELYERKYPYANDN